ncbi:hypothetical protein SAMN02745121_08530 [Nannocystis exedens]|uniref:Uncharacterized protein n=1 Tax=Nannocystis exedens TaxID=54 RepID=A0A1I2IAI2_9BACT|nr:hypothetical protein NAEX_06078 [Nannocystis exedens]SFF38640.1 hypothetical protein SAMN02745121_08530 [Nannocystis exedens]
MGFAGGVEGGGPDGQDGVGAAVMHIGGGQEGDAGVAVVMVVAVDELTKRLGGSMSNEEENVDERGALVLRPDSPRRGRFTLSLSDSFCFEVTESGVTGGWTFGRGRSASGWRCGVECGAYDGTGAVGAPRRGVGIERTVVQGLRGEGGVNQRTLTWWKSKLRSAGGAQPAVATGFVEVTEQLAATAPPVGAIELDVGGGVRIRVHGRVEAESRRRRGSSCAPSRRTCGAPSTGLPSRRGRSSARTLGAGRCLSSPTGAHVTCGSCGGIGAASACCASGCIRPCFGCPVQVPLRTGRSSSTRVRSPNCCEVCRRPDEPCAKTLDSCAGSSRAGSCRCAR